MEFNTESCISIYTISMEKWLSECATCALRNELLNVHLKAKNEALTKFEELAESEQFDDKSRLRRQIEVEAEKKFPLFQQKFEVKCSELNEKASEHNKILFMELRARFENRIKDELNSPKGEAKFKRVFEENKAKALQEFDDRKIGDPETYLSSQENLGRVIEEWHDKMLPTFKESDELEMLRISTRENLDYALNTIKCFFVMISDEIETVFIWLYLIIATFFQKTFKRSSQKLE